MSYQRITSVFLFSLIAGSCSSTEDTEEVPVAPIVEEVAEEVAPATDPEPAPASPRHPSPKQTTFKRDVVEYDITEGLEVSLDGNGPHRMGLDTGQSVPLILSRGLADELGLETLQVVQVGDGSGANDASVDLVEVAELQLGDVTFRGVPGLVSEELPAGASLGFGLFQGCLLSLEYGTGRLRITNGELDEKAGMPYDPTRTPAVDLDLAGHKVQASIDSAWTAVVSLPIAMAEELRLEAPPEPAGRARTMFNEMELFTARLNGDLVLGDFVLQRPVIQFNDLLSDAMLGNELLSKVSATFDQRVHRVVFEELESLPRVLILGDSISIGYTAHVQRAMNAEAVVLRPMNSKGGMENCAGTTNGIKKIKRWLAKYGGRWDVIHINFGLHDLKRVDPETRKNSNDPADPNQAPLELYEEQLRAIFVQAEMTGADLIFATTTPVPPGGVRPHRDPEDVLRYNEVGVRVAEEFGAEINDLYAFATEEMEGLQNPVDVHFKSEGSAALGDEVIRVLRAALTRRSD